MTLTKTQIKVLEAARDNKLQYAYGGVAIKGTRRHINGRTLQKLHKLGMMKDLKITEDGKDYLWHFGNRPTRQYKKHTEVVICANCGSWRIIGFPWHCADCGEDYQEVKS